MRLNRFDDIFIIIIFNLLMVNIILFIFLILMYYITINILHYRLII